MSIYQLLTLRAITSIHAGSGHSLDIVDLPIMRESHSNYPVIFGSALKGALRAHSTKHNPSYKTTIYGASDATQASAISVGDARLLAMPIRSLTTQYRLVTCPYLLQRLTDQLMQMRQATNTSLAIPQVWDTEIITTKKTTGKIYLEEYRYEIKHDDLLVQWQEKLQTIFSLSEETLATLSIVSNDQFNHLCQVATAITPHIKIEGSKTAKPGALWYEESLSPETLLYSLIIANDSHTPASKQTKEKEQDEQSETEDNANNIEQLSAQQVIDEIEKQFTDSKSYIQIGGNETVGMGWCQTAFYSLNNQN
jgi:CRISPR-associated protein Cmr4